VYLLTVGAGLIAVTVFAVRPLLRGSPDFVRRSDWAWSLVILAVLLAGRWPALIFPRELSVDESQLLAGAHTLTHDPVFWRAVNGGTAGPLDFFALWPAGGILGWDNFLVARVTALALIAAALVLTHQVLALLTGRTLARLAGLAALGIEALADAADFQHYSTELVPLALLAGAAYAATRRWTGGGALWALAGGLLLGAVPFAKLQPAVIAAAAGLAWLWAESRADAGKRHPFALVLGALVPTGFFAVQLTVTASWEVFWRDYLLFNVSYAGAGGENTVDSLVAMLGRAWRWDGLLVLAFASAVVWTVLMIRVRPIADRTTRVLLGVAALTCIVALACIVAPKRAYLHYWQLLIVPGTGLLGAMMAHAVRSNLASRLDRRVAAAAAIGFVSLLLIERAIRPNLFVGELVYFQEQPRSEIAASILENTRPGDAIAIWGRADHLYVETGLRQATRDSHTAALIEAGPMQDYFRRRYLADLIRTRPAVFLDAVGAGAQFKDPQFRHDAVFPELAELIHADYLLVASPAGTQLYRRRDLAYR
jgi:hypothetical protein